MSSFTEVLKKIDDATTAAANRVVAFVEKLKAKGVEVTAEEQAEADAIVSHLTGIAADAENPVPEPTPAPTPDPAPAPAAEPTTEPTPGA